MFIPLLVLPSVGTAENNARDSNQKQILGKKQVPKLHT